MKTVVDSGVDDSYLLTDLKRMDIWLCWQRRRDGDQIKKLPVNFDYEADQWRVVRYKDPDNWYSYDEAKELLEKHSNTGRGAEGLQVVIEHRSDDFVVVDFDDCIDPETGEADEWVQTYLDKASTYAEISPSGSGLHLIFRGNVDRQGWAGPADEFEGEVYKKYIITVTENHIAGTPFRAKAQDDFLMNLFNKNDIWWRELLYETEDGNAYGAPSIE